MFKKKKQCYFKLDTNLLPKSNVSKYFKANVQNLTKINNISQVI